MRNYEFVFIIKPGLEEEENNALVTKFEDIIKNGSGEITKLDRWGKRRLAYEINDFKEGYYVQILFQAANEVVHEIERVLNIQDNIIRHLLIKIEE